MILDLKELIRTPGGRLPFDFQLDLSELDFFGQKPFAESVQVTGQVENHAGLLLMTGTCDTRLHLRCDRCGVPMEEEMSRSFEHMLADALEDEENDEIVLLDGGTLDAGAVVTDDLILEMDSVHLCRPDCKGRCFRCGANLNEEPCRCKPEPDPRMAVLAKLLEQQ